MPPRMVFFLSIPLESSVVAEHPGRARPGLHISYIKLKVRPPAGLAGYDSIELEIHLAPPGILGAGGGLPQCHRASGTVPVTYAGLGCRRVTARRTGR